MVQYVELQSTQAESVDVCESETELGIGCLEQRSLVRCTSVTARW